MAIDVAFHLHDEFFQIRENAAFELILREAWKKRSTIFSHGALVGVK